MRTCVLVSVRTCTRIYRERGERGREGRERERGGKERERERVEGEREKHEEDNIYQWVEAVSVKDSLNYKTRIYNLNCPLLRPL